MIYAFSVEDGQKTTATPKARAKCPACGNTVIAKCGEINIWHWAHETIEDGRCDSFWEPETQWHLEWKSKFDKEFVEVVITKDGARHRADVKTDLGIILEFQNSAISPDQILARELFYETMVWVFNCSEPYQKKSLRPHYKNQSWTFRWKHARKSIWKCRTNVFLDFGNGELFEVRKFYTDPHSGYGMVISGKDFLRRFR